MFSVDAYGFQNAYLHRDQASPLKILYADGQLLAINKPAGQLFHGYTRGLPPSLVEQVKAELKSALDKAGQVYLGVVHRLDRPVSGLALFGRNSKFTSRLGQMFQERSVGKYYLAWVEGQPDEEQAALLDQLMFPSPNGMSAETNKTCSLSYRVLERAGERSLLLIKLGTGRRQQIRRQLALRGWPIWGDTEHGARDVLPEAETLSPTFRPIALHAWQLEIQHPLSYEAISLRAPLPFFWPALPPPIEESLATHLLSSSSIPSV